MTTYTRSGMVVNALAGSNKIIRGFYEDQTVDTLLAYIKCEQDLSIEQCKEASIKAVTLWVETGGLFNKQITNNVKLSANARSFINETAGLLSGRIQSRRVSWPDWRTLLCHSDSVAISDPKWTADELEELRTLQLTPTPVLIQRWVSKHGVGDLVQTLSVFLSPSV